MSKYRQDISREEFERIERYLLGSMDTAERVEFERLLSVDKPLRDEVELQRQLIGAVEVGAFTASITTEREVKTPPTTGKQFVYWRYVAAAALLIGVGLVGWWMYRQQMVSEDDLYAAYFRPDPGLPVVMSNDSAKYVFNEGMISYKEGNYDGAINVWKQLAVEKGVTDTLHYYTGIAYLNKNADAVALDYLAPLSENKHSVFHERAIWYLALLKLKEKDYVQAKRLLKQLPEKEEAVELLDRMAK
ncbi:hypothetical protein [Parapedobacter soli]|uniref:hypothetical protein n=1 Tax=Parapedobacter soli TaxID=416955 RepID=UPI0021CA80C9|nr:hypothetical protein [Parapedobacter soli]